MFCCFSVVSFACFFSSLAISSLVIFSFIVILCRRFSVSDLEGIEAGGFFASTSREETAAPGNSVESEGIEETGFNVMPSV